MQGLRRLRRSPRLAVLLGVMLAVTAGAVTYAATTEPAIHTFTPHSERQITNIDVLRQQIRNYYGDPLGTGIFAADSSYAKEASGVASAGSSTLARLVHKHSADEQPAIVLDVDDTTLATWNYEISSNWAFSPATNAAAVIAQQFPAVPGMVDMATQAAAEGYAIFYLTGRPQRRRPRRSAT